MVQEVVNPDEQVSLLAGYLEKWENDDKAKLAIIKGAGRAFSAGGGLKMFHDGRKTKDSCLEIVYRMYWLRHHIHSYKKTQVALVHGISMGGGASLMVPMKFSVVTEKKLGILGLKRVQGWMARNWLRLDWQPILSLLRNFLS